MRTKELVMNNQEVENCNLTDTLESEYSPKIYETLGYSKEYMEAMKKNYPNMTENEIIEAIEEQKNYDVYFHHRHEWITGNLIKKYLIIDKSCSYPIKITLETEEIHDCNLIKLTPKLQEKSYRWYRWDRNVVSHLIDRKDYPWTNSTNKLTIIGKRDHNSYYDEDLDEQVESEYFYVITAFRWDWHSKREPKSDYSDNYDMEEMEYWMNHALIPEKDENIRKTWNPYWLDVYYKKKKQEEMKSIYEKWKDYEYQAFIKYVKDYLSDLWREYDKLEVIQTWNTFLLEDQWKVGLSQCILVWNKWKFWVIEVSDLNALDNLGYYDDKKGLENYRKEVLEKDYSQDFEGTVLSDINNQNLNLPQGIIDFRQSFMKNKYHYHEETVKKILQVVEKINHKIEIDGDGNKLCTINLWNEEYKILEPNVQNHTDEKYGHYTTSDYTSIQKFKRIEVDLDWMRWDNPDWRLNRKLAEYVKEKESELFKIPWNEFDILLSELGELSGFEKTEDRLLLLMYLVWMDGNYWLSMDWKYRDKLRCEIPMFRSNVGNVSASLLLMKC